MVVCILAKKYQILYQMKKQIANVVCDSIIVSGFILSLANAADNYGLHNGNIHPLIIGQSDDTNGETNGKID